MSAPSDDLLPGPPSPVPPTSVQAALMAALHAGGAEEVDAQVGDYKLLQKIGEGGFGVVWLAEQQEPIRRHVALKIIKVGMDTREVIARFEAERQALALMDHPNIARVFDAGATDAGRPFFAMELVRGVPITRYCDENRLTSEARLRLFIPVCQAVQHAHQKGVIHRDLKPSNILVTLHDGVPVPKVIDFGIAKATTGTRLTERTLVTQFHAFIGTPVYTSPEQMEMSGLDVDTRSDIYGLGVLLYELLAGRPPFDPEVLLNSGFEAMRRVIREVEPPRPSLRLHTLPVSDRTTVAQRRATDSVRLVSLLRGDLDWIVMHCLEKDRTRRYETASGVARDVERYLKHEPVTARAPSTLYRSRKFIQRHKFGMAAAAAVVVSLLAGLVTSSILLVRERAARERAVASERAEAALRQEAEVARERETIRASRTARDLGAQLLAEGRTAEGLAWFVQAARTNPRDATIAPRLAWALAARSYLLPEGAPLQFPAAITNLHYIDEGRTIGVYCQDGTVAMIQAATGAHVRTKLPSPLTRQGVLFTERYTVALGRDGMVRLLEPATARIERELSFGRKAVGVAVRRSAAPLIFAALEDGSVGLADTRTGEIKPLPSPPPSSSRVQLSPDGNWLAVIDAQNREAQLRDLVNQRTLPVPLSGQQFGPLVFSPDSRRLVVTAVSDRGWFMFQLLDVTNGEAVTKPVTLHQQSSLSAQLVVGFSPDGRVLSIGSQFGHQLFDAVTGAPLGSSFPTGLLTASLPIDAGKLFNTGGPQGRYRPLLFRRASERLQVIAFPGPDGNSELTVRDAETGQPAMPPIVYAGGIVDARLSDDGNTLLVLGRDNAFLLWDLQTGRPRAEPSLQQEATTLVVAMSPDGGELAIARADGTLQRLRASQGGARALELARFAPMMPAPFLPESPTRLLWLRADRVNVIDVAAKPSAADGAEFPERILGIDRGQMGIGVRADARFMVVRTVAGGWQSWECDHGRILQAVPLEDPPTGLAAIFFHPVEDVIALIDAGPLQQVRFWNLATGQLVGAPLKLGVPIGIGDSRRPACFSPDGGLFAVGGRDGVVRLWDYASGKLRTELRSREPVPVTFVAFSPDGRRLAVGNSRDDTQLWDVVERRTIGPLLPGARTEFSPSGEHVMTCGGSTVRLWDGRSGEAVGLPMTHAGVDIRAVAFSADGRRLVTAAQDSTARIWDALTGQPICEPMPHHTRVVSCEFSPDGRFVRTEEAGRADHETSFQIWAVPPDPAGHPAPEWLLRLAEICVQKTIDEAGRCVDLPNSLSQLEVIRRELETLPVDAPFAEWGRWILDPRPERPIAPGFALTSTEAERLIAALGPWKKAEP